MSGDGMHNPFSPQQEAALARFLGLRDGETLTAEHVLTALEVNRVVAEEFDYLATALRLGWVVSTLEDAAPDD